MVALNFSDIANHLPVSWTSFIKNTIIVFGTISILYLAYLIVSLIFSIKRAKTLKRIEEKIDSISNRLFKKK